MTIEELKKMCMNQLSEGRNWVILQLPDRYPTGERMRMVASDRRSPLGEILNSVDGMRCEIGLLSSESTLLRVTIAGGRWDW